MVDKQNITKDSIKVQALTQSIASLVAKYEEQLAEYRAQATLEIQSLRDTISNLQNELDAYSNSSVVYDERVVEHPDVEAQEDQSS